MNDLKDFDGRVAFVTGAARGIGRASAQAFARRRAAVAVCDLLDDAKDTVAQIEDAGGEATWLQVDVSDAAQVREAVAETVGRHGRLDFAHNNAGIFIPAPLADLADEDFERVVAVNLNGVFFCLKYQLRQMLEQGSGSIVNTASIWGFFGAGAQAAYSATKHAVVGLTRTAAADYGPVGIRTNAVAPGPIQTAMTAAVPDEVMQQVIGRTQQKRYGQPGEIAEAVTWLCSDAASYVNGTVLPVDGGWMAA